MSGHSKWATTKRAKAVVDAKRGKQFTKIANSITAAAKEGGGNIEANPRLRTAVDNARAASMPKENIERAIKRGTGELAGTVMDSVIYEGFAPGGSAVMVEVITDNRNRTAQTVKSIFQKYGGSLGGPGGVAWMFDRRGVIHISHQTEGGLDELDLIELGAEDILKSGEETIIITSLDKFMALKNSLATRDQEILNAEATYWPKTPAVFPSGPAGEKLGEFLSALDDLDEVDKVATTAVL
jgi:YebC/PmpR family DNA-binding regulatory protein